MIFIVDKNKRLVRTIGTAAEYPVVVGYHKKLGAISENCAAERAMSRKRAGLPRGKGGWEFKVRVQKAKNGELALTALQGCETSGMMLKSPRHQWNFTTDISDIQIPRCPVEEMPSYNFGRLLVGWGSLAASAIFVLAYLFLIRPAAETPALPPLELVYVPASSEGTAPETSNSNTSEAAPSTYGGSLAFLNSSDTRGVRVQHNFDGAQQEPRGTKNQGSQLAARLAIGNGSDSPLGRGQIKGIGSLSTGAIRSGNTLTHPSHSPKGIAQSVLAHEILSEEGLDPNVVQATVEQHLDDVRGCYEQFGLRADATLQGRVAVRFEVGGQGGVTSAAVSHSTLNAADVERCICQRLMKWKFPKPMGGKAVKVTYPFIFRPSL